MWILLRLKSQALRGKLQELFGVLNIEITGYAWLGCSEDDWYHTGFIAKAPMGANVSGIVCSGIFKGSTVRFD